MKNIYCPISQEVVETGFKPITLVLHKVLSIKLLDLKIHLFSRTDVVQILLHLRSNLTFLYGNNEWGIGRTRTIVHKCVLAI